MSTIDSPRRRGAQDKPALLSTAAPIPPVSTIPAAATTADAPTAPAVPSTEPLPSDQATAAKVPVGAASSIADAMAPAADRPAVAPEDVPLDRLTPPAADAPMVSDVVMERVPGTVPLPSDQITPHAPAPAGSFFEAFHRELATLTDGERAMVRTSLFGDDDRRVGIGAGYADMEAERGGVRLFPVAYDVDHDGKLYKPGGVLVALTFAEHERLFRATAVRIGWLSGEVPQS